MKKILVIEDEPEMRRNLMTVLRLEKFHPLPAENGRIGVELARKEKPNLILCDVMMPELDGYGVIVTLRADAETAAIPFIFLTAKSENPEIRAGMNLGADDYLTKPVAKPDLLAAIHSRLERAVQQTVPGSFKQIALRIFLFHGIINGVNLNVQIVRLGNNIFTLTAENTGVNLTGLTNPVSVVLTIGDDTGRTAVTAQLP